MKMAGSSTIMVKVEEKPIWLIAKNMQIQPWIHLLGRSRGTTGRLWHQKKASKCKILLRPVFINHSQTMSLSFLQFSINLKVTHYFWLCYLPMLQSLEQEHHIMGENLGCVVLDKRIKCLSRKRDIILKKKNAFLIVFLDSIDCSLDSENILQVSCKSLQ